MGIIIMPYFLGAAILVLMAALKIFAQLRADTFNSINIIYGLIVSLLVYGGVVLSYSLKKKAWGLSPMFKFPFFMIYLPFVIALLAKVKIGLDLRQMSDTMMISIIISGLFIVVFNKYVFGILDKLGVQKQY